MASSDRGERAFGWLGRLSTRRPWLTVLAWLAVAGVLNLAVPQLETVVARDATAFVPSDTPAARGFEVMDEAFGSGEAASVAFVVVERDRSLEPADVAWLGDLADRLRAGTEHVADVQDPVSQPSLEQALVSPDRQAAYLPVAIRHPLGSPEAAEDIAFLREQAGEHPPGVRTAVTGDPATLVDINEELDAKVAFVTVLSVLIIVGLLALIYRRVITVLIPLGSIAVALLAARGAVALLGGHGLPVSTYTAAFLTALVLGAGTDYSIFLIARYHERLRAGDPALVATRVAAAKVGTVLLASAATVAVGTACMAFTELALFRTTGPSLAVSVLVTLAVSLTLTPALTALAGLRAAPRSLAAGPSRWWSAVGGAVVRRPAAVLGVGLLLLLALSAGLPTIDRAYDIRALQPAASESAAGERALGRHFPSDELRADYVVLAADQDLRTAEGLVALEAATEAVTRVPGVASVRGVTRPQGEPIDQAQLPAQVGLVGDRLRQAEQQLAGGSDDADRLQSGVDQLARGLRELAAGAVEGDRAADQLASGIAGAGDGVAQLRAGSGAALQGSGQLADGLAELAAGLRAAREQVAPAVDGLRRISEALRRDPVCTADPVCREARDGLEQIYRGQRDQLLPGLQTAGDGASRLAGGASELRAGLTRLDGGLGQLEAGIGQASTGAQQFAARLDELVDGAEALSGGAGQLAGGVDALTGATQELESGLGQAAEALTQTSQQATTAGVSAFYLPPAAFQDARFALARDFYLSPDGRTARLLVYGEPAGEAAAEARLDAAQAAARNALRGTPLASTEILATGPAAATRDLRELSDDDLALMLVSVLSVVFLTLVLLLRSLVAPVYLLATVILNYAAALGLTVAVWQGLLGQTVDWTVPVLSFVLLVAVGVDYNILLVSRIREEARSADGAGIARAVASTGGVITAAGVIFAGSFVAMLFTGIDALAQNGFAIAAGLLLDTFLVRTLLVPALAALLGRYNWWPSGTEPWRRIRELPGRVAALRRQAAVALGGPS